MKEFVKTWLPLIVVGLTYVGYYLIKGSLDNSALADKAFTFTISSGLLIWLIHRTLETYFKNRGEKFKQGLNSDLEIHKQQLLVETEKAKSAFTRRLETYKMELEKHKNQQFRLLEIRYNHLGELYKRLVRLDRSMRIMASPLQRITGDDAIDKEAEKKRKLDAAKAHDEFKEFFDDHKIFFSRKLCDKIEAMLSAYLEGYRYYTWTDRRTHVRAEIVDDLLDKAEKKIEKEAPQIKIEIETEFRNIIGSQNEEDDGKGQIGAES